MHHRTAASTFNCQPDTLRPCDRQLIPYFRFILAWGLLANLPFWLAPHFLDVRLRGVFNVEYILIGLASLFIPMLYIRLFFCASCFLDLLVTLCGLYFFGTNDLAVALMYAMQLPLGHVLGVLLLLFAITISWSILVSSISPKARDGIATRIILAMLALVVVLVGFDIFNGNNAYSLRDSQSAKKLATAPCFSFAKMLFRAGRGQGIPAGPAESATGALLNTLRQDNASGRKNETDRSIVLILVESFGLLRDASDAALVSAPFYSPSIRQHYDVAMGTVLFQGATVSGEFRELCGLRASVGTPPTDFSNCLPSLLKQRGYRTISFHGFHGTMFGRITWYPLLAFDKSLFAEQMKKMDGMNVCGGVLPGVCDGDVARLIGDYLANNSSGRNFVYWLTLNSHLPVPRSLANDGPFSCGTARAPVQDADVCMWMSLANKVNSSIAALVVRPDIPSTEFYIVGDHAPPFILQKRRRMFYPDVVPYIHLVPKLFLSAPYL